MVRGKIVFQGALDGTVWLRRGLCMGVNINGKGSLDLQTLLPKIIVKELLICLFSGAFSHTILYS